MVTFKLIQLYPGSKPLGYILKPVNNGLTKPDNYYQNGIWFNPSDYPKYWQEVKELTLLEEKVVEKDYEILSVITNNNKFIEKVYNQDATIEPYWKIHSVKRLSDGEIFTIGDKIQLDNDNKEFGTITELYISHEQLRFYCGRLGGVICHDVDKRNNFTKLKQKLFTTEDGVDIFEGDKYYYINSNFSDPWKIVNTRADCPSIINKNDLNYKRFSTKEKAEEYILYNKPLLSLSDVWDNLKVKDRESVLKFVKSKLNK